MNMYPPALRTFDSIVLGERASTEHTISTEVVDAFAALSGDYNPLHTDERYATNSSFGARVVHGFLLGAFVSKLIGMQLPGTYALIVSESLKFHVPVFVGQTITVAGTVSHKSVATQTITIDITILRETETVASGVVIARIDSSHSS
jgi:acyl dehydratase